MPRIQKSDLIGARIIEIRQTYEIKDGLDCCDTYFTTDRGFSFLMPFIGMPWETVEVPRAAERFGRGLFTRTRRIARQISKRTVTAVRCDPREPDSAVLVLDDGSTVSANAVAPHGTGGVGVYCRQAGESVNRMHDFFDVPLGFNFACGSNQE